VPGVALSKVIACIGPNAIPLREGERILIAGWVDDDGPLKIQAAEIRRMVAER